MLINMNSQKVKEALERQFEILKERRKNSNKSLTSFGFSHQMIDDTKEYYEKELSTIKNKIKFCEISSSVLITLDEFMELFPED